ncbi:MAG: DUF2156 domain-containing protein [Acutalibacteraceae bacterium]
MLKFKKTEIEDIEIFKRYIGFSGEISCESAFVNLLIWQSAYNNMWAEEDGQLIIKSGKGEDSSYRLPFGNDFLRGIELIREYSGEEYPDFWVQEGKRLDNFKAHFGDKYVFEENRDAFDYIYLRSDLAELSGKKYHGKRNHISAFSKKHDWFYRPITPENIGDVKLCAEKWYKENADREDKYLRCERRGVETVLDNMELLNVRGGAVYADGGVVAFTLGSQISGDIFDIHIEKALSDYAEGYAVINREFARTLDGYKYINREDDMGLEGLRRAKLSYRPAILLKKYSCRKKGD